MKLIKFLTEKQLPIKILLKKLEDPMHLGLLQMHVEKIQLQLLDPVIELFVQMEILEATAPLGALKRREDYLKKKVLKFH